MWFFSRNFHRSQSKLSQVGKSGVWHALCSSHLHKGNINMLLTFVISFSFFKLPMGARKYSLFLIPLLFPLIALAQVGSSVTQTLTIEVKPITKIAVSGNPGSLIVVDPSTSFDGSTVSDGSTSYSMLTNLENMKIVASISAPMPGGTKLMMKLESTNGNSDGLVDISHAVSPVDLVTDINRGSDLNQTITYAFAADMTAPEIESASRVITLTITQ
jgi:hypothetical protein